MAPDAITFEEQTTLLSAPRPARGTIVMRLLNTSALLLSCLFAVAASSAQAGERPAVTRDASQLITVVTPTWNDTVGVLKRFTRIERGEWAPIGSPITVNMGRSGLAWGRGRHGQGAPAGMPGPIKREGDGRAPAGVFHLSMVYGYEAEPLAGARSPYQTASEACRCVDDVASRYYNQVIDAQKVDRDWNSDEAMRRSDDLYRWVVFVDHNVGSDRQPGFGSCIFLHVQRGPGSPTAGCTSMERTDLETLIRWIEPTKTLFVTLPEASYTQLQTSWDLPRR